MACLIASSPGLAKAGAPALPDSQPAAQSAPASTDLSAAELSSLATLNAQDPGLLKQSAGEGVIVVEEGRRRGWRGGARYRDYGYGYGFGSVLLTALLVTVIVLSVRPGYR